MNLVPKELDKLFLNQFSFVAQKRLARGCRLNHSESTALIASQLVELARDGNQSVAELMDVGKRILGRRHVLPQVLFTLKEVQVEATFPDGTFLMTVHDPICTDDGNLEIALFGSFLPIPTSTVVFPPITVLSKSNAPGAILTESEPITLNKNRNLSTLIVTNDGDRSIQVGSHFHFVESNAYLRFDRLLAYGTRLDIPAGTSVRFEPGETRTVNVVEIGGKRIFKGGNGLAERVFQGSTNDRIVAELEKLGFRHTKQTKVVIPLPCSIDRNRYAGLYGPTVGDRVRLGDTDLVIEIEFDLTFYGEECKFGGGKVLRTGMGQAVGHQKNVLDLVITNALILDYSGIYKADIGIKNGIIVGIGKAGNPDMMDGVTEGMIVGASTEAMAGEGQIITAGAIDSHVHFICPQLADEAIASGITTLIGGGTGPNSGTAATTCTAGAYHIEFMFKATDTLPVNIGFTGKGNCSDPTELRQQIKAGAIGLKLHEDWGTTPEAIDCCLSVCDEFDVQTTIHTDTLNECGYVETTINAIKGRTIHTYHSEGAGGGHAPDIICVCGEPNVIPSSTNPTRPYTTNTVDEHLDMLMVCHHLSRNIPEDVAFAESRIRPETIAAEDILQDLGAISIISSDSQAMGRIGEVVCRTWKTAHKLKVQNGYLCERTNTTTGEFDKRNDNFRAKRYVSKAIAHGVSHLIGSVEVGKVADLVMYPYAFFGTKPSHVFKAGTLVRSMMGDANASIPTTEPILSRPMFGSLPSAVSMNSIAFVSKCSVEKVKSYGLKKRIEAVKNCRNIGKKDLKLNDYLPKITVDAETYEVMADGKPCTCEPFSGTMPMSQSSYAF